MDGPSAAVAAVSDAVSRGDKIALAALVLEHRDVDLFTGGPDDPGVALLLAHYEDLLEASRHLGESDSEGDDESDLPPHPVTQPGGMSPKDYVQAIEARVRFRCHRDRRRRRKAKQKKARQDEQRQTTNDGKAKDDSSSDGDHQEAGAEPRKGSSGDKAAEDTNLRKILGKPGHVIDFFVSPSRGAVAAALGHTPFVRWALRNDTDEMINSECDVQWFGFTNPTSGVKPIHVAVYCEHRDIVEAICQHLIANYVPPTPTPPEEEEEEGEAKEEGSDGSQDPAVPSEEATGGGDDAHDTAMAPEKASDDGSDGAGPSVTSLVVDALLAPGERGAEGVANGDGDGPDASSEGVAGPAKVDEKKDKRGEKEEGDEKKVAGPVDVADGGGRTPLHWAALGDSPEMMRVLIDLGADVKACNENGNTVVHYACTSGSTACFRLLMEEFQEAVDLETVNSYGNGAFLRAVAFEAFELVEEMITEYGIDQHQRNKRKENAVIMAALQGNADLVSHLIDRHGCAVDVEDEHGRQAIHRASTQGHIKVISQLLDRGADPRALTKAGSTLAHLAAGGGELETLLWLMERFEYDVEAKTKTDETILLRAALGGDFACFKTVAEEMGGDITARNRNGDQSHRIACNKGWADIVRYCLRERGLLVNEKNTFGNDCLLRTAAGGHVSLFDELIRDHGADLMTVNNNGDTVLHVAAYSGEEELYFHILDTYPDTFDPLVPNKYENTCLHRAAASGSRPIIDHILEHHRDRVDMNAVNSSGDTMLLIAAHGGHKELCQWLISEHGLDPQHTNNYGNHAVHRAAAANEMGTLKFFVEEHGLDPRSSNMSGDSIMELAAYMGAHEVIDYGLEELGFGINHKNETYGNGPLLRAAAAGLTETVEYLIERGADVEATNKNGDDILRVACYAGSVDVVRYSIETLGRDIEAPNAYDNRALHRAVIGEDLACVKLVVEHGADVNVRNRAGDPPLLLACHAGSIDVVRYLLDEAGAELDVANPRTLSNTVLRAAVSGSIELVEALINDYGVDPQSRNGNGDVALRIAANSGHMDLTRHMIEKYGQDPREKNNYGNTALLRASAAGYVELVDMLILEHGCHPATLNRAGDDLLRIAAYNGSVPMVEHAINKYFLDPREKNRYGNCAVLRAVAGGRLAVVKALLEDFGVDPESCLNKNGDNIIRVAAYHGHIPILDYARDELNLHVMGRNRYGNDCVLRCAVGGHLDMMKRLLEIGAVAGVTNDQGHSAFRYAAREGHTELVTWMLDEHGGDTDDIRTARVNDALFGAACGGSVELLDRLVADYGGSTDIVDGNESNLLIIAAEYGHVETATHLIDQYGLDLAHCNRYGNSAVHRAASGNHLAVLDLLVERGGDVTARNRYQSTPLLIACRFGEAALVERLVRHYRLSMDDVDQEGRCAIQVACINNCPDVLDCLIRLGADMEVVSEAGESLADLCGEDSETGARLAMHWVSIWWSVIDFVAVPRPSLGPA